MIFRTETNSHYEIDETNKRIRRLSGEKPATSRQAKDGDWRTYKHISGIKHGNNVMIVWDDTNTPLLPGTAEIAGKIKGRTLAVPTTVTSRIVEIHP